MMKGRLGSQQVRKDSAHQCVKDVKVPRIDGFNGKTYADDIQLWILSVQGVLQRLTYKAFGQQCAILYEKVIMDRIHSDAKVTKFAGVPHKVKRIDKMPDPKPGARSLLYKSY
jgi:hypothetical protein